MDKKWFITTTYGVFNTYEEAEVQAKRCASREECDYLIMESVALAKAAVPIIEIVKF